MSQTTWLIVMMLTITGIGTIAIVLLAVRRNHDARNRRRYRKDRSKT